MRRCLVLIVLALLSLGTTAAVAKAPKLAGGNFSGKTAQGYTINVGVRLKGKCGGSTKAPCLTGISYKADYKCFDPATKAQVGSARAQKTTLPGGPAIRNNKASAKFSTSSGDDTIDVAIKFSGKTATGTFREVYTPQSGHQCISEPPANGKVSFSIKH